MKRIGVLSDTHAYLDERVFHHFADCHEIWHAGDLGSDEVADKLENFKPLRAVAGNIDSYILKRRFGKNQRFLCENIDVFLTHIGGYPGRYAPEVRNILYCQPPKIFVCGHSHILKIIFDKNLNMLCINPGAAGQYGQQIVQTLVKFEIDGENIQNMQVIELAKKELKNER